MSVIRKPFWPNGQSVSMERKTCANNTKNHESNIASPRNPYIATYCRYARRRCDFNGPLNAILISFSVLKKETENGSRPFRSKTR